jgi:hypothetical protein
MQKLFLIIVFLASNIAYSQITKDNFEKTYPDVKEVSVMSDKLEMGYQDQYISESDLIAYKVNGIYVVYDEVKWFIPYKRIESIGSKDEVGLLIYLKG